MDLKEIRDNIDTIDSKILFLLYERMEQAVLARRFKTETQDTEREGEILAGLEKRADGLINPTFIRDLYKQIMKESRKLQDNGFKIIGFQGEHGANSEIASWEWDDSVVPAPCRKFSDIFKGVQGGCFDFGIIPVENTLGGVVGQVNDLLINSPLPIVGAVELTVHHCLLTLPGTNHREIRRVYSHPQALAQCREFLERNSLEPVNWYDTAGAARMLMEDRPPASAAIATRFAAQLYNLEIIKEQIEDHASNKTRFLILSGKEMEADGSKCSITFSTEHRSGTLFQVLKLFADTGLNLTRIESFPAGLGSFNFFLDFLGSDKDPKVIKALGEVEKTSNNYRLMGCYHEKKC